uniref:Transcription factor CBF/NF-Y/archaeal histone domain-containing protein n=1 Tax=Mucochytrium quahogii TaxID=96639 RepID=A0A7S2S448_9STRA|mmetsp:Transcript_18943/g.30958  ORF Transcript_18943/g.30958 Transcript_18943/m.30958 type:complete len:259 (-) Transcript_18943:2301-3077(-)|eukprot:CAMPEP_0203775904 /NCGR_PEP_ID=MMETSP0099_2-20121227/6404_1 /ASSEMBLY_ACC=CAM_ASM_000209 /TAXON_ID=96639 /ORGANISM=" , Strain NY0313808BC1" /LENGTH=258 /DNA_ID=CAMNT_0050674761 /DNA_START=202 /DNA_END=981 /DNA_ORIENTATION=+
MADDAGRDMNHGFGDFGDGSAGQGFAMPPGQGYDAFGVGGMPGHGIDQQQYAMQMQQHGMGGMVPPQGAYGAGLQQPNVQDYAAYQPYLPEQKSEGNLTRPAPPKGDSTIDVATIDRVLTPFWEDMTNEISGLVPSKTDFKTHSDLPLARIKRIMKADEDVRMVSAEAPVMFARACRMFILEITKRAWLEAEDSKRRTLQKEDVHAAILKTDIYDFLVDVVDGTIEEEQRQMKFEQKRKATEANFAASGQQPPNSGGA